MEEVEAAHERVCSVVQRLIHRAQVAEAENEQLKDTLALYERITQGFRLETASREQVTRACQRAVSLLHGCHALLIKVLKDQPPAPISSYLTMVTQFLNEAEGGGGGKGEDGLGKEVKIGLQTLGDCHAKEQERFKQVPSQQKGEEPEAQKPLSKQPSDVLDTTDAIQTIQPVSSSKPAKRRRRKVRKEHGPSVATDELELELTTTTVTVANDSAKGMTCSSSKVHLQHLQLQQEELPTCMQEVTEDEQEIGAHGSSDALIDDQVDRLEPLMQGRGTALAQDREMTTITTPKAALRTFPSLETQEVLARPESPVFTLSSRSRSSAKRRTSGQRSVSPNNAKSPNIVSVSGVAARLFVDKEQAQGMTEAGVNDTVVEQQPSLLLDDGFPRVHQREVQGSEEHQQHRTVETPHEVYDKETLSRQQTPPTLPSFFEEESESQDLPPRQKEIGEDAEPIVEQTAEKTTNHNAPVSTLAAPFRDSETQESEAQSDSQSLPPSWFQPALAKYDKGYKYEVTVRGKDRELLPGSTCLECEKFYRASKQPGEKLEDLLKLCSRHKHLHAPKKAGAKAKDKPQFDHWDISFPATQEDPKQVAWAVKESGPVHRQRDCLVVSPAGANDKECLSQASDRLLHSPTASKAKSKSKTTARERKAMEESPSKQWIQVGRAQQLQRK
eukprot:m.46315 g.46315  ORF g.46315 m.46315 type:complete len:672 (-) comp10916_c0_seq1:921-2936(-)